MLKDTARHERNGEILMGSEQSKASPGEERPFKGVPSEEVGRGSGQDPPDMPDEDQPECEALTKMKEEFKEQAKGDDHRS
jgi:hypothetical protein